SRWRATGQAPGRRRAAPAAAPPPPAGAGSGRRSWSFDPRPGLRFAADAADQAAAALQRVRVDDLDRAGEGLVDVRHEHLAAPVACLILAEIAEQLQPDQRVRAAAPGVGLRLVIRPDDGAAHAVAARGGANMDAVLRVAPDADR